MRPNNEPIFAQILRKWQTHCSNYDIKFQTHTCVCGSAVDCVSESGVCAHSNAIIIVLIIVYMASARDARASAVADVAAAAAAASLSLLLLSCSDYSLLFLLPLPLRLQCWLLRYCFHFDLCPPSRSGTVLLSRSLAGSSTILTLLTKLHKLSAFVCLSGAGLAQLAQPAPDSCAHP